MEPARARLSVKADGFSIIEGVLTPTSIQNLLEALREAIEQIATDRRKGRNPARNLLRESEEVYELACCETPRAVVDAEVGQRAIPVSASYLPRTHSAAWKVVWRQDTAIAVRERVEAAGFGPWSLRDGVWHAEAPAEILEQMVSVRLHLDDCPAGNGALCAIPGTHTLGRLTPARIREIAAMNEGTACAVRAGDAVAMRPLLVHALTPSHPPLHPRVLRIDYCAAALPEGLEWL